MPGHPAPCSPNRQPSNKAHGLHHRGLAEVVLETELKIVTAHKGKAIFQCRVEGLECHSALDEGVNAIEIAAEVITHLRAIGRQLQEKGPLDTGFDPPFTTIQTGTICGGTAVNILPKTCDFAFEFRCLPSQSPMELFDEVKAHIEEKLLPEMHARSPETGVYLDIVSDIPGLHTPEDADIVALAKNASGENATTKISFCTEGGVLQEAGIPTIICGPGSVEQAHKPDEFVTTEQMEQTEKFLRRFIAAAGP
ncbi:MAG: M20/M25/M40 family metallo-hydrolase [Alphaproteobacteria bacterium]